MRPMPQLEIVEIPISELVEYANNAKLHPHEQIDQIANSISEFGNNDPIAVWHNENGEPEIVEGHGRLMALRKLGIETAPVIYLDHLTDEQRRAYALVHNKLTMNSDFDFEILADELAALDSFDMGDFGFDIPDLDIASEPAEIVEDNVPEDAPSVCKLGDIWQLGRHRLMCGDARNRDDVDVLTDGNAIDLALTDPPYGVSIVKRDGHLRGGGANEPFSGRTNHADKPFGSKAERGSTRNYAKNAIIPQPREYAPIIGDESTDAARDNYEIIRDISDVQIIFGGNYFTDFLPPSRCWIVWDKKVPRESFFAQVELAWCSKDGNSLIYEHQWSGLIREGSRDLELETRVHPTQKPVGMLADIISDFTDDGGTVIDCFGGSGSTLIAAEHTGRTCYMMELDPHYCDIIIKRWEDFTGQKAVRVDG